MMTLNREETVNAKKEGNENNQANQEKISGEKE